MRMLLTDSGPLYALVDPDDRHHARAHFELARIGKEGLTPTIAFPTLLESFTLISRKLGFGEARRWLAEITRGSALVNVDRATYLEAAALVDRFEDQAITLFDAVLAALAPALEAPIWTYDSDFDVMRAEVWR